MPENGITKVRFDLWAVLAFLCLLAALSIGYLFTAQAKTQDKVQDVCDRTTRIEANYEFIVKTLGKLEQGQEALVRAVRNGR